MTQLVPLTVYLPLEAKLEADARAADKTIVTGVMLRLILLGKEPPLGTLRP